MSVDPENRLDAERFPTRLRQALNGLLGSVYPDHATDKLLFDCLHAFWPDGSEVRKRGRTASNASWSERDVYIITYGNSFVDGTHKPLDLLHDFLSEHLTKLASGVHILPYFPYTSDDGFAVTDYRVVDSSLGVWEDVGRIADDFKLMSDLVINHCSSQSKMFTDYLQGHSPYDKYFFEASPEDDLSAVVRPRAHELLRKVETANGTKHVWCTFSHDQVDFDFSNPNVLLEFLRIMRFHIDRGVRTFRLDAVAFLWKQIGTTSIHLPQTHEIIRLLRVLADFSDEPITLITETNVPNFENLSYFGNRNEAHVVYNFSLPPLLLHGLLNGTSRHLNRWQMSMPPAQQGCTYLNFTASHDGIGLRPAEGLLSEDDLSSLIKTVRSFGGLVSQRKAVDGTEKPYEINVSLYDALAGTVDGKDQWNTERFLCSQILSMGLEGIPSIYIHSLLATANDLEGVQKSGHNRAINRHRWHYPRLLELLKNPQSRQAHILNEMKRLLSIRTKQPAFHPNATQFTLQLGDSFFGFWRQSTDRTQSIFALHSMISETQTLAVMSLNLIGGEEWVDLLSGETIEDFNEEISFAPYQCRWITNKITC